MTARGWLLVAAGTAGLAIGLVAGRGWGTPPNETSFNLICPTAGDVSSSLVTHIGEKEQQLELTSTLEIHLSGVKPPNPNWRDFQFTSEDLVSGCLGLPELISPGWSLTSLDWADGSLTARLDIAHRAIAGHPRPGDFQHNVVISALGRDHYVVAIGLCQAPLERPASICGAHSRSTIQVQVDNPATPNSTGDQPVAQPFPSDTERKDNTVTYTWKFTGLAPPVTVSANNVPLTAAAGDYLSSNGQLQLGARRGDSWGLNLNILGYGLPFLLALLAGACSLWRSWRAPRLIAIAVGAVVAGGVWLYLGDYNVMIGSAIIAAGGLVIIAVAAASSVVPATLALGAAVAVGLICWFGPFHEPSGGPSVPAHVAAENESLLGLGAAVTALMLVTAIVLFQRVLQLFDLRSDDQRTDYQFRNSITAAIVVALSSAVAFPLGAALTTANANSSAAAGSLGRSAIVASADATWPLLQLSFLLVVAALAAELRDRQICTVGPKRAPPAGILALMFGLAAPWSPDGAVTVAAAIPLWPLQVLIIWIAFRQWLNHEVQLAPSKDRHRLLEDARRKQDSGADRSSLRIRFSRLLSAAKPDAEADAARTPSARVNQGRNPGSGSADPGCQLLQLGVHDSAPNNAQLAATQAGYLAVPLILYFVWTTLGQHNAPSSRVALLYIVIGLLAEAARWVVTGFLFGYLYRQLPGHTGLVKALWFAGLWVLSCLAPTAIARGLSIDLASEFVYRSAQFGLFVIILAVLIDLATVKAAGGTWRDLRAVYAFQDYREVVAALAPAALLAVTLAQQIASGSGLDVARSFLSGITGVVP